MTKTVIFIALSLFSLSSTTAWAAPPRPDYQPKNTFTPDKIPQSKDSWIHNIPPSRYQFTPQM